MEKQILDVLLVIVDSVLLIAILHVLCPPKETSRKWAIFMITILSLETLALQGVSSTNVVFNFIPILTALVYSIIFLSGSIAKRILSVVIATINLLLISSALYLIGSASGADMKTIVYDATDNMGYFLTIANKLLLFLEYSYLKNHKIRELKLSRNTWIFLVTIGFISILNISLALNEYVVREAADIYIGTTIITLIIVNILVFKMSLTMTKQAHEKANQDIYIQAMEYEEKMLKMIEDKTEKLKNIRHDMNHHITAIKGFIDNGNQEAANKYLRDIPLPKKTDYIHIRNAAINYIVNDKAEYADTLGIKVDKKIIYAVSDKDFVENVDTSIVLGNMIDNAIEACGYVEKDKFISVEVRCNDIKTTYIIENSTTLKNIPNNRIFTTNKQDNDRHGRGLRNIESVVKKYDGVLEFDLENDIFTCTCVLLNPSLIR